MNARSEALIAIAAPVRERPRAQERSIIAYPLLLLLGVLLVLPATAAGQLLYDSFAIDWVWADQFTAALSSGTIYPRWLPLSDGGLGAPVFYYYPPLAFHLTGILGILGLSTYASVIAAFAISFGASGVGCWHWLKDTTVADVRTQHGSNHPLLGAVLFMAAPYHLLDFTLRGALAESLAIALIPPLAIGLRRIARDRGGILLTAGSYGAMICTHLPLALLVSLFLIAPWAILNRRRFLDFALASGLGLALSAIYLLPALMLEPYRDVGQLYRSPNLRTDYWSIYANNWKDPIFALIFAIIGSIFCAAVIPAVRRRDGWAAYALGIGVAVSGVIPLLWSLPLLREVQFPYRALPLAEFALASALARLPRRPHIGAVIAVLPLMLLSLVIAPGFHIQGDSLDRLRKFHPDVYEYLPKGVMKPGQTHARLQEILAGRIPPPKMPPLVVEPHFYFPAWSCGEPEPRTKLLMHEPSCTPRIVWTGAEKLGGWISLLACLFAAFLFWRRTPNDFEGAAEQRIPAP